jgi:hypothetical protein
MVKMADRITNLQPPPPGWDKTKIGQYLDEAVEIQRALGSASQFLSARLLKKIEAYRSYVK